MENRAAKTEQPTAKRLDDARRKGNVPRTIELSGALVIGTFLLYFELFGDDWLRRLESLFVESFTSGASRELVGGQLSTLLRSVGSTFAMLTLLPVGFMASAAMLGNVLQGPPAISSHPMKLDWTKLNPFRGIKKVFRLKALVDLSKAVVKMALVTWITLNAVQHALTEGLPGGRGAEGALQAIAALSGAVILRVVLLLLGIALIDLLYTRWDHRRGLQMTKQEVKEERKQLEGDPHVRARIRSKQMALSRSRMIADVAKATVVVTNPTHYAVALRYGQADCDVPRVVAKGANRVAARIIEEARKHRVPIRREPPLARALFRSVAVGEAIPEILFRAVAEVLALVLRGNRGRARSGADEARRT